MNQMDFKYLKTLLKHYTNAFVHYSCLKRAWNDLKWFEIYKFFENNCTHQHKNTLWELFGS
jgi:hypothetical protein